MELSDSRVVLNSSNSLSPSSHPVLTGAAVALSYQTTCKNVTHMFSLFKGDWLSGVEVRAHPQNTNKGNHMWGDELGKLHNIFIRYSFTCLVDRLQGDTLQINSEPRWLTRANLTKRSITKPREQLMVPFIFAMNWREREQIEISLNPPLPALEPNVSRWWCPNLQMWSKLKLTVSFPHVFPQNLPPPPAIFFQGQLRTCDFYLKYNCSHLRELVTKSKETQMFYK